MAIIDLLPRVPAGRLEAKRRARGPASSFEETYVSGVYQ